MFNGYFRLSRNIFHVLDNHVVLPALNFVCIAIWGTSEIYLEVIFSTRFNCRIRKLKHGKLGWKSSRRSCDIMIIKWLSNTAKICESSPNVPSLKLACAMQDGKYVPFGLCNWQNQICLSPQCYFRWITCEDACEWECHWSTYIYILTNKCLCRSQILIKTPRHLKRLPIFVFN